MGTPLGPRYNYIYSYMEPLGYVGHRVEATKYQLIPSSDHAIEVHCHRRPATQSMSPVPFMVQYVASGKARETG